MRRLAQPKVVTNSAIAAAMSAVLSLPRMLLWDTRKLPVWYLEATVFFGGFVLWAFVFAWHTEYTKRPVFTVKIKPSVIAAATLAGIFLALSFHFFLDPVTKRIAPQDFPTDLKHWIASTLFTLAFMQLFLLFAPFAWVMRLAHSERAATWFTVAFAVAVLIMRTHITTASVPPMLFIELLILRVVLNYLGIRFYLRGGILIVWWLELLVEARHLLEFQGM